MNAAGVQDGNGWQKAALRWIEHKTGPDGSAVCELIYELEEEPDSLRQMVVPKTALFEDIRRGDAVMVEPESNQVRRA